MKVLFVTGLTGFGLGGARTEEIRLVQGIARRGAEVAMCSDVLAGELAGTRHYRLDYPPADQAPAQLQAALADFQPQLVHVVGGGVRFLADCDRAFTRVPWLFTAHNVPPAERIFPRFHGNARLHYAVRNALALPNVWSWSRYVKSAKFMAVICHSQTVAGRLEQIGCPRETIIEIPFGSELPEAALAADPSTPPVFAADAWPKIVTVAGLAHHKGQVDALRMVAKLLPDHPRLSYRLIGMSRDKRYRAFLEKTIADLKLTQHVALLHSAPEATKFAALREADLYVQPSHEEGFCIAFLEAAMLSPRLIGADTGAIAAMARGDETARVVKVGDVDGLAAAARQLLSQSVSAADVERRRSALQTRYAWDAYLDAHQQAYRDILATV